MENSAVLVFSDLVFRLSNGLDKSVEVFWMIKLFFKVKIPRKFDYSILKLHNPCRPTKSIFLLLMRLPNKRVRPFRSLDYPLHQASLLLKT